MTCVPVSYISTRLRGCKHGGYIVFAQLRLTFIEFRDIPLLYIL